MCRRLTKQWQRAAQKQRTDRSQKSRAGSKSLLAEPLLYFWRGLCFAAFCFLRRRLVRAGERERLSEALGSGREPSKPQLTEAKRARPYAKNKVAIALFVRYLVNKCFTDRICFLIVLRFKLSEAASELRRRMRQALSEATRAHLSARVPSKKASQPQADKGGGGELQKALPFESYLDNIETSQAIKKLAFYT